MLPLLPFPVQFQIMPDAVLQFFYSAKSPVKSRYFVTHFSNVQYLYYVCLNNVIFCFKACP